MNEFLPIHFISEAIEVEFDLPPALEKKPGCPNAFVFKGNKYIIVEVVNEWHDYHRRGRMARNMRPEHASVAEHRGSRGVGLDYFRVRTSNGQILDLYYDRAPKDAGHTKGGWFLDRELEET